MKENEVNMNEMNKTKYLKIVTEEQSGVNPKLGYDLVVFKEDGKGLRFHKVLRANEMFDEKSRTLLGNIFKERQKYISYAVSTDPNIKHTFNIHILHSPHGHTLDVDCTMLFSVSDRRIIVDRLADDPVRKVQMHVQDRLEAGTKAIPWNVVRTDLIEKGGQSLSDKIWKIHGFNLVEFAKFCGINLKELSLNWRLSDEDTKNEGKIKQEERNHKYEMQKEENKSEISKEVRTRSFLDKAAEKAAEGLGHAFINIGDNITATGQLGSAIDDLKQRFGPSSRHQVTAGSSPPLLPRKNTKGIHTLLDEAVQRVGGIATDPDDMQQILSAVLHLIAELILDEQADKNKVEKYSVVINEARRRLIDNPNSLRRDEQEFLKKIVDHQTIKNKLREFE